VSKKKKTLDELLGEVLVSKDEQPYEIPENWVWSKLEPLVEYERGITFPASAKKNIFEEGLMGCARTANIQAEFIWNDLIYVDKKYLKSENKLVKEKDILMSISNSYHLVGKVSYVNEVEKPISFGGFLIAIRTNKIESKFLFYYLRLLFGQGLLQKLSGQTTNIANLNSNKLNNISVPVPTLDEQKRIVNKIKILFAKLDRANQLIAESKETFALRRAAVFKEIYGDPNKIESKHWKTIGELFYVQIGSTPSRKVDEYWNGENSWLSSGEVHFNRVKDSKEKVTDLAVKEARLKLAPKGSILFGMIGEGKTRGQVAILDIDSYHNQNMASIWVSETNIPTEYVYYWLVSKYTENRQNSSGNNQPAYNKTRVQALTIPIYEETVMQEKVKILSKLEELESKVSDLIDLEENISTIKQSILSKAFKGELNTYDATNEPAIELLKSILQEKI